MGIQCTTTAIREERDALGLATQCRHIEPLQSSPSPPLDIPATGTTETSPVLGAHLALTSAGQATGREAFAPQLRPPSTKCAMARSSAAIKSQLVMWTPPAPS